jgi:hypothetical protein
MSGGSSAPAPSQPTQQTITSNPIADWAQPTATALIGSQMNNAYNIDSNGNITGSKGFTPFGGQTNAQGQFTGAPISQQQYNDQLNVAGLGVAGPSALQQQSYQGAANLQTPGAYGQATQAAGYGAANAFGMANSANPQDFQNQVGGYMNPYLQQALAPSLALQQQQFGQIAAQNAGQATQAGAFGGGRDAVVQGLNQQNQMLAQNQLVGNAYNNAFGQAQNQYNASNQFGLQANQAGVQNASQMATTAGQGLQAQQGILGLQNQMGTQEQQNQQNLINQAMQNYSNQQQYPQQQAANIMNLIRSTPTTQTQTTYAAPPNPYSQVAGLAATGIGAYGALKAEGGEIKEKKMASGGIASGVPAEKLPSMLEKLSDQQLAQKADLRTNDPQTAADAISQQSFRTNARAGTPGFAPGGIVAFAEGGTKNDAVEQMGKYETPDQTTLNEFYAKNAPGTPAPIAQAQPSQTPDMMAIAGQNKDAGLAYLEAIRGARPDKTQQGYLQLMNLGANTAAGTSSNFLTNLAGGAKAVTPQIMQDLKENRQSQLEEAKAGYDVSKMDSATLMEIAKNASQNKEKELDRLMHMGMSKQQAEATMYTADQHLKGVFATNAATIKAAGIRSSMGGGGEDKSLNTQFNSVFGNITKGMQKTNPITGVKIPLTPEEIKIATTETLNTMNGARIALDKKPLTLKDIQNEGGGNTSSSNTEVKIPAPPKNYKPD